MLIFIYNLGVSSNILGLEITNLQIQIEVCNHFSHNFGSSYQYLLHLSKYILVFIIRLKVDRTYTQFTSAPIGDRSCYYYYVHYMVI